MFFHSYLSFFPHRKKGAKKDLTLHPSLKGKGGRVKPTTVNKSLIVNFCKQDLNLKESKFTFDYLEGFAQQFLLPS